MQGYCSWCLKKVSPRLLDRSYFSRNLYVCPECNRTVVECRACKNFACWGTYEVQCPDGKPRQATQHDQFCGEHRHTVANFRTLDADLADPAEYLHVYDSCKKNLAKYSKVGLLTLGGIAVAGPLVVLARPAVGGAIGGWMGLSGAAATNAGLALLGGGSLAAGGFGMAGGMVVLTVAGSAVGGAMGAYVGNAYFGAIQDFCIRRVRNQSRADAARPAIITVNGFLSQKSEGIAQWQESLDCLYPKNEWFHLEWEAKRLAKLGSCVVSAACLKGLEALLVKAASTATDMARTKIGPAATAVQVVALSKNPWHVAMVKADQTGVLLADIIRRCRNRSFILCGHSLGARVIYATLRTLATTNAKPIDHVHLLGGAIGDKAEDWRYASLPVCQGVFNYYSLNDDVLKYLYKAGTFFTSDPIGRNAIDVPCVKNVNVSAYVPGHMQYKVSLGRYGQVPGDS